MYALFLQLQVNLRHRDDILIWFTPSTYSVRITGNCTSLSSALGEVYPIQQDYQWRVAGRWFPLGSPISLTNRTDRNGIHNIFSKVPLHTVIHSIFLLIEITVNEVCDISIDCFGKLLCLNGTCQCPHGYFWHNDRCSLSKLSLQHIKVS